MNLEGVSLYVSEKASAPFLAGTYVLAIGDLERG